tara:strand:- start:952 stop:1338 length:387 start_codon:yes stop_codon:yes gene_type:complete
MLIKIPVSVGELADKITILEIKKIKIKEKNKLVSIDNELYQLKKIIKSKNILTSVIIAEIVKLKKLNLRLWNIEDSKRKYEKNGNFDEKFVKLARNVYLLNDKRAHVKLNINKLTNSNIIEIKSYNNY